MGIPIPRWYTIGRPDRVIAPQGPSYKYLLYEDLAWTLSNLSFRWTTFHMQACYPKPGQLSNNTNGLILLRKQNVSCSRQRISPPSTCSRGCECSHLVIKSFRSVLLYIGFLGLLVTAISTTRNPSNQTFGVPCRQAPWTSDHCSSSTFKRSNIS